jgi:hypothetical protein
MTKRVSPLWQRMINNMTFRNMSPALFGRLYPNVRGWHFRDMW